MEVDKNLLMQKASELLDSFICGLVTVESDLGEDESNIVSLIVVKYLEEIAKDTMENYKEKEALALELVNLYYGDYKKEIENENKN